MSGPINLHGTVVVSHRRWIDYEQIILRYPDVPADWCVRTQNFEREKCSGTPYLPSDTIKGYEIPIFQDGNNDIEKAERPLHVKWLEVRLCGIHLQARKYPRYFNSLLELIFA